MQIGLESVMLDPPAVLSGRRLGLLMNQASVDARMRMACDVIADRFPGQLKALFCPQHGLWGEQQANMVETSHGWYAPLGIPIHSLYSETRRPTPSMLDDLDCIVVDLQDVGTRVYTFIWTMLEVLRACADAGKSVLVLDRPNPLGGLVSEGCPLDPHFTSFVGGASIPLRHGLTMAELARLFQHEFNIDVDLNWSAMQGWKRGFLMSDTGRAWLWPSPNMPTLTTTLIYPGQVLLEGVNLSEGRGTTRPFEVLGAPYVDSAKWLDALRKFPHPGAEYLETRFQPTFDKWRGESCQGIDIQVLDPRAVRSVQMTIAIIATAARLFPEFQWLEPPYEYEAEKMPIDILFGSDRLRLVVEAYRQGLISEREVHRLAEWDSRDWQDRIRPHLLYA